jgi:hypothetical protein
MTKDIKASVFPIVAMKQYLEGFTEEDRGLLIPMRFNFKEWSAIIAALEPIAAETHAIMPAEPAKGFFDAVARALTDEQGDEMSAMFSDWNRDYHDFITTSQEPKP